MGLNIFLLACKVANKKFSMYGSNKYKTQIISMKYVFKFCVSVRNIVYPRDFLVLKPLLNPCQ